MQELNTEYLRKVGERLRELREKKGTTQDELAQMLGAPRTAVVKQEMGVQDLKSETIVKLCDYYGVSADYLLRGASSNVLDIHRRTGLTDAALNTLAEEKNVNDLIFGGELGRAEMLNEILADKEFHYIVGELAHIRARWQEARKEIAEKESGPKTADTIAETEKLREGTEFLHWKFSQALNKYTEKLLGGKLSCHQ
ncbi:MAG: helix-turn-helix domain-containing protein [Clostridiales bacterium]|jgi:transcriptional regulator with XRE-family HTH domain|nr:helix-turn-helix domain-containing protein [Clostridiales bacterium]